MQHRARTALLIGATLLCLAGQAWTQQQFRVVDVVVEGNNATSESLVLGVASFEKGKDLTPTAIAETIRRLYGLGVFDDVQIDAEPVTGGLKLYIVVRELPRLTTLEFSGNKKIKTKELRDKLAMTPGRYVSQHLVSQKKNVIAEMYAEKGYFQARITPSLQYNEDSTSATLRYEIDEKSKVKVETVVLTGSVRVKAKDIVGKMRNRKRGFLKTSDFAQDEYDEDLEKIIDEYHKRGFMDAHLISDSIWIDTTRNRMTIYLDVYEGPRYYFGDVTVNGAEVLREEAVPDLLKYEPGEVFNQEKYDKSFDELYSAYYEIGHLHIRIADIKTTRADTIVDITYEISEGLPSHVNMVRIVGNYKTKEKVIRREISMLPGQVFNQSRMIRSIRDVMALNYFESVVPTPISLPNGDVDMEFEITEKRTGQIMAGAGYNSLDKLVGNVGMGIPNFRGNGQDLTFNIEFGKNRNSFSLSFTEPWLFGRPTLLGASLYTINRNWYDEYTEGRQGGSLRLGRRLRWPDNYFRVYASYLLERNRFFDFDDDFVADNTYKSYYYYDNQSTSTLGDVLLGQRYYDAYPGSVLQYEERYRTASRFAFTVTRDSRNLPEFATSGSIASYTFENTGGPLGGFWEYLKHDLKFSKFFPLLWGFALAAKVEYGVVTSSAGDDHILVTDRFTPGGTYYDGTVRGYDGGSLTPDSTVKATDTTFFYHDRYAVHGVDPPDDTLFNSFTTRVRGKHMIVSNVELQYPFKPGQIYGLAFFDAGNSWLHLRDVKPLTGLYRSVGFGFRIVMPGMGTFGFDFGYALDDHQGEGRGWKPHFQYGTTFR